MKIAVVGATGNSGSRIVAEALKRGHVVTGIARSPDKLSKQDRLTLVKGDAMAPGLADLLRGHDAVVSSVHFSAIPAATIIGAVKAAGAKRLAVVGGAGSLEVAPGVQLVDTPDFPAQHKTEALAGREFLEALKAESALDWTYLSPSALFAPGEATRKFRLGTDQLLSDEKGQSHITTGDFAIALVDELESPRHSRKRFTVGY